MAKRTKKVIHVGDSKKVEAIAIKKGLVVYPTFDEEIQISYGISKTKGNLNSLMTDFLYIQESKAKYISLHHLTSINKNLLNNPIFLKQRIKEN